MADLDQMIRLYKVEASSNESIRLTINGQSFRMDPGTACAMAFEIERTAITQHESNHLRYALRGGADVALNAAVCSHTSRDRDGDCLSCGTDHEEIESKPA